MESIARLRTVTKLLCPHCGDELGTVDHLFENAPTTFGPWTCEGCNYETRGKVLANGTILVSCTPRKDERKLCLLKLRDLYVVVTGYSLAKGYDHDNHADYLFHSHQCPVNLMRAADQIYEAENGADPHGVFRLVAHIPDNAENRAKLDHTTGARGLAALFAVFGTDGQPLPSEWPEENGGVIAWVAELQRAHKQDTAPKG